MPLQAVINTCNRCCVGFSIPFQTTAASTDHATQIKTRLGPCCSKSMKALLLGKTLSSTELDATELRLCRDWPVLSHSTARRTTEKGIGRVGKMDGRSLGYAKRKTLMLVYTLTKM